jgi:hypothetical protein
MHKLQFPQFRTICPARSAIKGNNSDSDDALKANNHDNHSRTLATSARPAFLAVRLCVRALQCVQYSHSQTGSCIIFLSLLVYFVLKTEDLSPVAVAARYSLVPVAVLLSAL